VTHFQQLCFKGARAEDDDDDGSSKISNGGEVFPIW
jgi:hypothetical protein